jgi:intracellular sulfur oxidation DsrE/DsrF family protein
MRKFVFFWMLSCTLGVVMAQDEDNPIVKKMRAEGHYPVMNGHVYMGTIPFPKSELKYSGKKPMKVAIDLAQGEGNDSTHVNFGWMDIGRTYNLHILNGVPQSKLDMVVIVHAQSVWSLLTHEAFREKYGMDNPHLPYIRELVDQGVKIYMCSQNLTFFNLKEEDITSEVRFALSAKTALTHFQQERYSLLYFTD